MNNPQSSTLRLQAKLPDQPGTIRHNALTLLIGSCFAAEVGERLVRRGFPVAVNPFGTLFNPLGIFELLSNPSSPYFEGLNSVRDGRWVNYRLHSKIQAETEAALAQAIQNRVDEVNRLLPHCSLIIITLGTAWAWSLKSDGRSLANLHKQPQQLFERRLLGIEEIAAGFSAWHGEFKIKNPSCQVLLTVSPVLHGKAELHENNLSKSALLLAASQITQRHSEVGYFPSYEIIRDELRDYRFYADDMQHPSAAAVEYVTECFLSAYADPSTLKIAEEALAQGRRLSHREGGTGQAITMDWAEVWRRCGVSEEATSILEKLS